MERTMLQIREHYEIEKELSNKLRSASTEERRHLYSSVYNEFFSRVTHHPQIVNKSNPKERLTKIYKQLKIIKYFINKNSVFAEIGAGDCALSLAVAPHVKHVYGIEVSKEIAKGLNKVENFDLIISDGISIPLADNSVDIMYSYQVMEHIHPEDAFLQLQNIYKTLASKGVYICITPNRINGPHDISMYFDREASGFHLKEYTSSELDEIFRRIGFSKIKACIGGGGIYMIIPIWPIKIMERILLKLPYKFRIFISRKQPFKTLLHVRIIGIK